MCTHHLPNATLEFRNQGLYRLVRRTVHPVLDLVRHAAGAAAAAGRVVDVGHGIALPGRREPAVADTVVPALGEGAETSHSGVLGECGGRTGVGASRTRPDAYSLKTGEEAVYLQTQSPRLASLSISLYFSLALRNDLDMVMAMIPRARVVSV